MKMSTFFKRLLCALLITATLLLSCSCVNIGMQKSTALSLDEYTVECGRPDTITKEKLDVLANHGVTRISINPQTFCNKTLKEICLVDQPFVKDPGVTVGQYTKDNGCAVAKFVRFAVGEGMQKREDNFVEEVMSQLNK